ncbi:MAG: ATP synthase F1 subunit gamma [Candidatus Falkowbacteria bacterium]|nr:ATP synthase F1 subunit gamma [Candidatus Falkowbacteria bacterium]
MSSTKGIKSRIKSVSNTKKVTKAMEMVAASKMRKATEAVLKTKAYARLSWETILRLSMSINNDHPLLSSKEKSKSIENKKIAIILFTSNRGLCGGFNSSIITKLHKSIHKHNTPDNVDIILLGKKGATCHSQYGYNIIAEFTKPDMASGVADILTIAKMITADFINQKYSKVFIAYTDFINAMKQEPKVKQILPVDISAHEDLLESIKDKNEYIFEPSPREVLDELIPRLIEIQIFQALLESNASEHSARMTAMHQATDAASDMIDELTLSYNKIRQASITQEIAEIGAGVNAMSK